MIPRARAGRRDPIGALLMAVLGATLIFMLAPILFVPFSYFCTC